MRHAINPKPVYPVEAYERDLAEMKLARTTPRPRTDLAPWIAAAITLLVILGMMFAGSAYVWFFWVGV